MNAEELKKALEGVDGDSEVFLEIKVAGGSVLRALAADVSHDGPDDLGFSYLRIEGKATRGDLAEAAEEAGILELPGSEAPFAPAESPSDLQAREMRVLEGVLRGRKDAQAGRLTPLDEARAMRPSGI